MTTLADYPVLSRAERDRRIGLARALMAREGLDGLILGQGGSRVFQYFAISQQYFSNEPDGQGALLVIPREGEPVLLALRTQWGQIWAEQRDGAEPWISDYRRVEADTNLVTVLKEKGLDRSHVGVVLSGAAGAAYGGRPVGSLGDPVWLGISQELPELRGSDVSVSLSIDALPKSVEEQVVARYIARVAEDAHWAYVGAARGGGTEIEMHAAAMAVFARAGVECQNIMMVLGNQAAGMGLPRFLLPNRPPRRLRAGDVVMNEMFPTCAGIEVQLSLSVHVGEPTREALKAHQTCREAHAAAMERIKPGVTFLSVWEAMRDVVFSAGCWNWTPLIHSLSPMALVAPQHHDLDKQPGLDPALRLSPWPPRMPPTMSTVLEEGMLFSVEPGAALGGQRSRTGCLAMVTADGAEALTSVGTHLHVVD